MRSQKFIFNKDCEITAYILGFLWADGWLDCKSNKFIGISMEILKTDFIEIEEHFKKLNIEYFQYERSREGRQTQSTLRYSDKNFIKFLIDNDFENRKTKGFNKILSCFSEKSKPFFIKGLFDGDGCYYINKSACQITLSSSYDQNYEGLTDLLLQLNIKFTIQKVSKTNKYSALRMTSRNSCIKFINFLENCTTIGLSRKNEKMKKMIGIIKNGNVFELPI